MCFKTIRSFMVSSHDFLDKAKNILDKNDWRVKHLIYMSVYFDGVLSWL